MMDFNSVGRLTELSPITWKDGCPYFGLPGNEARTPRTWVKPKTATPQPVHVPYRRSDDFSALQLQSIWQWNHVPVDGKWSLSERPGFLRLHALPATTFYDARNTLTQRAIGPMSTPTVLLDASNLKPGDTAGLGLLNLPYATLGVEKLADGLDVVFYDQRPDKSVRVKMTGTRIWLRADCDFLTDRARFSYSFDGITFTPIGDEVALLYQTFTFQGIRYGCFSYNTTGVEGGYADFDSIDVYQPHIHGLMRPIPYGRSIRLASFHATTGLAASRGRVASGVPTRFEIVDRRLGRVALRSGRRYVTVGKDGGVTLVAGQPGTAQNFQWIETPTGELVLMSLATNRFLRIDPQTGDIRTDSPAPCRTTATARALSGRNKKGGRRIRVFAGATHHHALSEVEAFLDEMAPAAKIHFLYTYDMGDNWEHEIVVEKILPAAPDEFYPICVDGERNHPLEDSGGIWGYTALLDILADPSHEEHKDMKAWLREAFGARCSDGEAFDLGQINKRLKPLQPKPKRVSRRWM